MVPKVSSLEFYYNNSHILNINKQQEIHTPQWETQVVDFFDYKYYRHN